MSIDNSTRIIANMVHAHIPGSKSFLGKTPGDIKIYLNEILLLQFDNKGFDLVQTNQRVNYRDIKEGGPKEVAKFLILQSLAENGVEVIEFRGNFEPF